VSELMIGQGVRLRDLLSDVTWTPVTDPDRLLVHVIASKVEEEPTEEAAEELAATPEGGGEPEVIKKGKAGEGEEPAESK